MIPPKLSPLWPRAIAHGHINNCVESVSTVVKLRRFKATHAGLRAAWHVFDRSSALSTGDATRLGICPEVRS